MANPLSDNEKDELKALQDIRKGAGNGETVMSDSQRLRLSELLNRQQEAKQESKKEQSSAAATATSSKSATK